MFHVFAEGTSTRAKKSPYLVVVGGKTCEVLMIGVCLLATDLIPSDGAPHGGNE